MATQTGAQHSYNKIYEDRFLGSTFSTQVEFYASTGSHHPLGRVYTGEDIHVRTPHNPYVGKCEYCSTPFKEDGDGRCDACGAPLPLAEDEDEGAGWVDIMGNLRSSS